MILLLSLCRLNIELLCVKFINQIIIRWIWCIYYVECIVWHIVAIIRQFWMFFSSLLILFRLKTLFLCYSCFSSNFSHCGWRFFSLKRVLEGWWKRPVARQQKMASTWIVARQRRNKKNEMFTKCLERWSNFRILGNVGSSLLTTARTASSSACCAQQLAALTRHCNAVS